MVEFQNTQPLPVIRFSSHLQETREQKYRRLKALSDRTGVRFFFVYLHDLGKPTPSTLRWKRGMRT